MPLLIIDTGYGLERFCWAAAGTPTIYEAIYPDSVELLKNASDFNSKLANLGEIDIDALLGELSRLAGILNIDVGTDVESLYSKLVERLGERGITIGVEQLKGITEPLSAMTSYIYNSIKKQKNYLFENDFNKKITMTLEKINKS